MARTAKRYLKMEGAESTQIPVYKAGIYARLSVDHEDKKSESIETQVEMLKEFIQRQNGKPDRDFALVLYDTYTDLGKTGTNFERPGFERLMRDIREGKVNCILVKDFSRFGRNYIETGDYLEKIFPFLKVRFISVSDQYDSFSSDSKSQELSMNIKHLVNEAYAKDISAKERAAKRTEQKRGSYVGSIAPYGYHCEEENGIRRLVADPDAAEIVRRIFTQYADGMAIQQIIDGLFEDGIHRVSDYKIYHHVYWQEGELLHEWGNSSIRAVLNRNNYYGDLVQHKYESRFARGEKWCDVLEEKDWIVTPDAHEAIISKELFDRAQKRLKAAKEARTSVGWDENDRAFYNVFYCGDCGRKLATSRTKDCVEYFCQANRYKDERHCTAKYISEEKMQTIVRTEITRQLQLSGIRSKDMTTLSKETFQKVTDQVQDEINRLDTDAKKMKGKTTEAFTKYKEGELSLEAFQEKQAERKDWEAFFEKRKKELEQKIRMIQKRQKEEGKFLRSLLQLDGTTRLNQELVEALIERIELYADGRLEISFKFKGVMEDDR
jgi:DNA invertase Pin-like site-specific DNA recombinase